MPSVTLTPKVLHWTGGDVTTTPVLALLEPASLRWIGGVIEAGPSTVPALSVTTPRLDRFSRADQLVDKQGNPSARFQTIYQKTMEAIEGAFAGLTTQVGDNTNLIGQIQASLAMAQEAIDNVKQLAARVDLANSYTDPAAVLTAASDGTITIAAHTRVYDNGTRVSVNGGTLTGFSSDQFVRVYYVDAARAGGTVTYQGTTADIVQSGDTHVVGGVAIPAAGSADSSGTGTIPPGYVFDPASIVIPFI